ncbi:MULTISPECIES: DUF2500 domain-containing protein [Pontibacillus]|uniref:DUF2500 domain-containing protein n=1 Tax=Pontibacillus chungwhensis TaxID=265426 RepID=A0ABY8V048_9BACI|nr:MULTISPECIES: DUF2500 domain-containing protein [Pontibacillus]MCD5324387.1 DUF2500 domain-containing protein [Pontibacillus sp. HN14]WIF99317.1 DUF2500 domain-containing protein [Pontibacillus chungwhensis]
MGTGINQGPSDLIFSIGPYFIAIVFIIVIGGILFAIFSSVKQWSYNNKQPVLAVNAKVIGKRTEVKRRGSAGDDHGSRTRTYYYTTFEVESGDRMELPMDGREQGLLAEGDIGTLTFQGTRFKGFDRMAG